MGGLRANYTFHHPADVKAELSLDIQDFRDFLNFLEILVLWEIYEGRVAREGRLALPR